MSTAARLSELTAEEWCIDESFWQDIDPLIFPEERIDLARQEVQQLLALHGRAAPLAVLDLGCGLGRHSLEFARLGHTVVGIDQNNYLLDKARANAKSQGLAIDFQHRDMRESHEPQHFDLCLCLYSTFGYFQHEDDDLRVLRNAYHSLKPGGKFVVDIGSKETIARNFEPLVYFDTPPKGSFMHRIIIDDWQRICLSWYIKKAHSFKMYNSTIRLYSGKELSLLLKKAGFSHIHLYGDFNASPFDSAAKRLIIVAEKL